MKPRTHALTGCTIGFMIALANNYQEPQQILLVTSASIAGAIAPDIPTALRALVDKWQGREPFDDEQPGTPLFTLKEISHSIITVIGLLLVNFILAHTGLPQNIPLSMDILTLCLWPFFWGYASHIIIDLFTHGGKDFIQTDQSFLWPFGYKAAKKGKDVPKMSHLLSKYFIAWEYRIYGALNQTKITERIIQKMLLITTLSLLILILKNLPAA